MWFLLAFDNEEGGEKLTEEVQAFAPSGRDVRRVLRKAARTEPGSKNPLRPLQKGNRERNNAKAFFLAVGAFLSFRHHPSTLPFFAYLAPACEALPLFFSYSPTPKPKALRKDVSAANSIFSEHEGARRAKMKESFRPLSPYRCF